MDPLKEKTDIRNETKDLVFFEENPGQVKRVNKYVYIHKKGITTFW